jgi:hypothetical protein
MLCTFVAVSFLISISAFAQSKAKPLGDSELDRITAGGSVALTGGMVTTDVASTIELSNHAQEVATAMNVQNLSDSVAAGGVNVWSGNLLADTDNGFADVVQRNTIMQDGSRSATVSVFTGEVRFNGITGDEIAVGGGSVDVFTTSDVSLSNNAQADIQAMNIVNAATSIISNGINVASAGRNSSPLLTQVNTITQSR